MRNKLFNRRCSAPSPVALAAAILLALACLSAPAKAAPVCPAGGGKPSPAYGAAGAQPRVGIWRNIGPLNGTGCGDLLSSRVMLAIALAGRFRFSGSLEDLARRVGAVSRTKGLRYWSVTDGNWRVLLDDAYASKSASGRSRRADFSAAEVLSGRTLYLAQDDTRSTGTNAYSFRTVSSGPDRFAFEMVNLTAIGVGPVTFFPAGALKSLHFLKRESGDTWAYYGFSIVKSGNFIGPEGSYVNRNAAFFRFLAGQKPDGAPPLAR